MVQEWGSVIVRNSVIQYHTVLPLKFAEVAFCKSLKTDHVVGKLKCRGKFLHSHHCIHLSILNYLVPETCEKYKWARWRAVWPQLKDWCTGEGNHEFCGRKIQSWRQIMVLYLVSCFSNSKTFIMELPCRWSKLLVTHLQTYLHEFPFIDEHFFVPMLDYSSWQ